VYQTKITFLKIPLIIFASSFMLVTEQLFAKSVLSCKFCWYRALVG